MSLALLRNPNTDLGSLGLAFKPTCDRARGEGPPGIGPQLFCDTNEVDFSSLNKFRASLALVDLYEFLCLTSFSHFVCFCICILCLYLNPLGQQGLNVIKLVYVATWTTSAKATLSAVIF